MHRLIRDHLEVVLAASRAELVEAKSPAAAHINQEAAHLNECEQCRAEVEAMRRQAETLRELRTDAEPQPGFYARVMERIETQGALSIWNVFFDSPFGRRIAVASMVLALILGVYLVTSERMVDHVIAVAGEDQPGLVLTADGPPDRDAVLVNLVTYREQ
jgi:predicted anti-sigma-YlaC factor YlaD